MAINYKHHWEKNPVLSRTLTNKEDFDAVNKKALAKNEKETVFPSYIMMDGVPHKMTKDGWVAFTKM